MHFLNYSKVLQNVTLRYHKNRKNMKKKKTQQQQQLKFYSTFFFFLKSFKGAEVDI